MSLFDERGFDDHPKEGKVGRTHKFEQKRGKVDALRGAFLCPGLTKEGQISSPLETRLWSASAAPQQMSESGPQKKKKSPSVREKLLGSCGSDAKSLMLITASALIHSHLRPPQLGRRARSLGMGKTRKEVSAFFVVKLQFATGILCPLCEVRGRHGPWPQWCGSYGSRATRRTTRRDSDSAVTPPRRKRAHHRHHRQGKVGPKR